ncbi:MAG: hypothetical protein V4539_01115 [Bacteroidota bacterium]
MKELTAEKAKKILAEHGTEVTLEEAEVILKFMIELATMSLDQIFEDDGNTAREIIKEKKKKK